jgi:peptidoglycan-N-acetylglucosamine deacetylase
MADLFATAESIALEEPARVTKQMLAHVYGGRSARALHRKSEKQAFSRPLDAESGAPETRFPEDRCRLMRQVVRDLVFGSTAPGGSDIHEVALTFDDGPNDPYTYQLLELLDRYQVRATFFLIGSFVRRRPEIARALLRAGHLLGNHTMTHPSLLWERPARVREELAGCNAAIEDATGETVRWFRPPFGARRRDVLRTARELGLIPVMWNAWGHDWDAVQPHEVTARVQEGIYRNQRLHSSSNVLLHDGGHAQLGTDRSVTLAATDSLLAAWSSTTLRLVTLDAWHP